MTEYADKIKAAMCTVVTLAYDEHGTRSVKLFESVRVDGNWIIAQDKDAEGYWQIGVRISDGEIKRYRRPLGAWEEVPA